jgi:hypothetical protein
LYYRDKYMDIKSIIKNAIAERLHESVKIEEPKTPEINTTSEFVNYLAEAVKFKIEELSIDTLKSYKAKVMAQDPTTTPLKRELGNIKATTKIDRAQRRQKTSGEGYDRGVHVQKQGTAADPDAAARKTGSLPVSQINKMGVRKSTKQTRGGVSASDAAENRLKAKTDAHEIRHGEELAKEAGETGKKRKR